MVSVTLNFHGIFKGFCPDPVTVEAASMAGAIDMVTRQLPGFRPDPRHGRRTITIKGVTDRDVIQGDLSEDASLDIWPSMQGGGGQGGFIKIILGVVLIAASVLTMQPGGVMASMSIMGMSVPIGSMMMSWGISMLLGGLLEMVSPAPKIDLAPVGQDPEASKYLGGGQNTVRIGTRIPLLYGTHLAFGHYISFNIDAKDVNAPTTQVSTVPVTPVFVGPEDNTFVINTINPTVTKITLPSGLDNATHIKLTEIEKAQVFKDYYGAFQLVKDMTLSRAEAATGFHVKPTDTSVSIKAMAVRIETEGNSSELGVAGTYTVAVSA